MANPLRIAFYTSVILLLITTPDYAVIWTRAIRSNIYTFFTTPGPEYVSYYQLHSSDDFKRYLEALIGVLPETKSYSYIGLIPEFPKENLKGVCYIARPGPFLLEDSVNLGAKLKGKVSANLSGSCITHQNVTKVEMTIKSRPLDGYFHTAHIGIVRARGDPTIIHVAPILIISELAGTTPLGLLQDSLFVTALMVILLSMGATLVHPSFTNYLRSHYKAYSGAPLSGALTVGLQLITTPSVVLWTLAVARLLLFITMTSSNYSDKSVNALLLECLICFVAFLCCFRLLDYLALTKWVPRLLAIIHFDLLSLLVIVPILLLGTAFVSTMYITPHIVSATSSSHWRASSVEGHQASLSIAGAWPMVLLTTVLGEPAPVRSSELLNERSSVVWFALIVLCVYHLLLVSLVVNVMIKVVMSGYEVATDDDLFSQWCSKRPLHGWSTRYFVDMFAIAEERSSISGYQLNDDDEERSVGLRRPSHWRLQGLREFLHDHTPTERKKPKRLSKVLNLDPPTTNTTTTPEESPSRLSSSINENSEPEQNVEKLLPPSFADEDDTEAPEPDDIGPNPFKADGDEPTTTSLAPGNSTDNSEALSPTRKSSTLEADPFLRVDDDKGTSEVDVDNDDAQPALTTSAPTTPSDCNPPDQPVTPSQYPTPCRLQG
ncbi:hypothetical protein FOL47_011291 [Perkinsus chesapeaki]|uniref:Uncharacterized protein n=1 Tax=Perkinsus chesapeaki TaxID=330153 RepID=A0A7J6KXS5_PERCH|nr:hypothetical protein FOL47_011291 [Perkinsus chesapeaki]